MSNKLQKEHEVILSTGMASYTEIGNTIKYLRKRLKKLTVLHCISSYPTKTNQVQINNMLEIKNKFNVKVGFPIIQMVLRQQSRLQY